MTKFVFALLFILVPFTYQLFHCVNVYKDCNWMNNPKIEHCLYGDDEDCYLCEDNYSYSEDHSRCINVANCAEFDSEDKCTKYNYYYNFNEKKPMCC